MTTDIDIWLQLRGDHGLHISVTSGERNNTTWRIKDCLGLLQKIVMCHCGPSVCCSFHPPPSNQPGSPVFIVVWGFYVKISNSSDVSSEVIFFVFVFFFKGEKSVYQHCAGQTKYINTSVCQTWQVWHTPATNLCCRCCFSELRLIWPELEPKRHSWAEEAVWGRASPRCQGTCRWAKGSISLGV